LFVLSAKAKLSPAGLYYEVLVSNWLASKGYYTRIRQRSRASRVGEVDIIARKKKFLGEEILFVECKDKKIVTLRDFQKFVTKFSRFQRREAKVRGLLVYTGELEPDVKDYYNSTLDSDLKKNIELIKKTRKQLQRFTKLGA
jgi:Holliday junction resolvase-like predicted endonuclease